MTFLAIAMVLVRHARLLVAQACGTDRRCATWLFATTRMGWPTGHGLEARPLNRAQWPEVAPQWAEVAQWVQSGPARKTDGVPRWRCADLRDRIAAHFGIRTHEHSVGKLLHALDCQFFGFNPSYSPRA